MGAWGPLAFDNDTANDWSFDLDELTDLSLVEEAFADLEEIRNDYLDQDTACCVLAACEVLARCQGNAGYKNAYSAKADAWVTEHPLPVPPDLLKRAGAAIDRVLGNGSELRDMWNEEEGGDAEWRDAVEDLRKRLGSRPA